MKSYQFLATRISWIVLRQFVLQRKTKSEEPALSVVERPTLACRCIEHDFGVARRGLSLCSGSSVMRGWISSLRYCWVEKV